MIKTGKFLLFLTILCNSFTKNLSLEIQLTDTNGKEIKKAKALIPFMLIIKDHKNKNLNYIDIEGIENFEIKSNGQKLNITNKALHSYFCLKAKYPGKYPIKISNPKTNQDASIEIIVKDPQVKFNIILDTKNPEDIFIGQKVNIILKLLYKENKGLKFNEKIVFPEIKNLIINIKNNFKSYQMEINDKLYHVIELYGYLCPEKSEEFMLENFFAYFVKFNKLNNFFQVAQEEVYPNKITKFNVKELPDKAKYVDAVGKFNKFNITVEKNTLNKEEPILLKVSITGDTCFDKLNKLNLNIPQYIDIFEPKIKLIKENNQETKEFEYIIQPVESGALKIPPQHFKYFDPEDKTIKSLSSQEIILEVNDICQNNKIKEEQSNTKEANKFNKEIKNLIKKNSKTVYIPWSIFYILLSLPIGVLINLKRSIISKFYNEKIKYNLFSFYIFNKAIKKIKKAKNYNQAYLLYPILKNTLAHYILKQDITNEIELSDQDIIDILIKNNIDNIIIENYKNLSQELLNYTKYNFIKNEPHDTKIFDKTINFVLSIKKNKNFRKTKFKNIKYYVIFLLLSCFTIIKSQNNLKKVALLYKIEKNANSYDKIIINNIINNLTDNINEFKISKLNYFINLFPLIFWQILFFILWSIFLISFKNTKQYLWAKLIIFILLIISGSSIILIAYEKRKILALIKNQNSNIYLGPDEKYPIKDSLNKFSLTEILNIDSNNKNWYYIKVKENKGWIKKSDLKLISKIKTK